MSIERGDGVGIELTHDVLRAVRLSHELSSVAAAAEVPVHDPDDDRALLDAFVRARSLLGNPTLPTRIALFPADATMWRIDVTGYSGRQLHERRLDLERTCGATSTILVDDGPRRWLHVLHWTAPDLRRIEDVAERAGLLDTTIEPSPLALARVCADDATCAERSATSGERWVVALDRGVPVAAATVEAAAATDARLFLATGPFVVAGFDEPAEPFTVARQLTMVRDDQPDAEVDLRLNGFPYPRFARADLRAPERQCVALGAAVGAAGLAGRLRPIDVVIAEPPVSGTLPWAVEPVSNLTPLVVAGGPSATRRLTARLVPRRRG